MPPPDIVARLDAESAVRRLIATYARAVDGGDFDAVADLLKHAEFNVAGRRVAGRDAIRAFLEAGVQRHADGTPRTWHIEVLPGNRTLTEATI